MQYSKTALTGFNHFEIQAMNRSTRQHTRRRCFPPFHARTSLQCGSWIGNHAPEIEFRDL